MPWLIPSQNKNFPVKARAGSSPLLPRDGSVRSQQYLSATEIHVLEAVS